VLPRTRNLVALVVGEHNLKVLWRLQVHWLGIQTVVEDNLIVKVGDRQMVLERYQLQGILAVSAEDTQRRVWHNLLVVGILYLLG